MRRKQITWSGLYLLRSSKQQLDPSICKQGWSLTQIWNQRKSEIEAAWTVRKMVESRGSCIRWWTYGRSCYDQWQWLDKEKTQGRMQKRSNSETSKRIKATAGWRWDPWSQRRLGFVVERCWCSLMQTIWRKKRDSTRKLRHNWKKNPAFVIWCKRFGEW